MKNKILAVYGILGLLLLGVGILVYKLLVPSKQAAPVVEDTVQATTVDPIDPGIKVDAMSSKTKDHTVVVRVSGLGGKVQSVSYELTYESQGLVKGVNSGSKPIVTTGQDSFEREVYLGTCSRNVCKPDLGVTKVSVALEFNNTNGKKSQFSKDYEI